MTFYLFFNCRIIALQYLIGFCHTSTWIIHVVVVIVIQSISTFSLFVTHRVQHARFPCPLLCPRVCSNSWILSPWCYSTISSSVAPFSSYLQSFPASGSYPNESFLLIRWSKWWNFIFSISPSSEYSGLSSFRIDWFDLLAVHGTLKSLLQHHRSKASILWCSVFFMIQLSHLYKTRRKTIALTIWSFVGVVMSLFSNMLSKFVF